MITSEYKNAQTQPKKKNWLFATENDKGIMRADCTPAFNAATGINLLIMTIYYLLFVTGPSYVMRVCGLSLSSAGLTSGIMILGCLGGRFASGDLINRIGGRPLLFLGIALNSGSIFLFTYASSGMEIFASHCLTGFGVGLIGTVTATIVANIVPNDIKAFGISLFSLSTALALALGPFFGIILSLNVDYLTLTQALAVISLAAILPGLALQDKPGTSGRRRHVFRINNYIDPRVARFSITPMIVFLGYGCLQAFIASYARELGISSYASVFFIIYAVVAIGTRPFIGKRMDNRTENAVIYPILLVTATGLVLLGWANSGWMMLLSAVFLGFGYGNFQSVGQAVAVLMVTPSRYSQATSTFFISMDLGIGLGPYIFGLIVPMIGFSGMYGLLAFIVLLCAIPYHFLHGRNLQ